MPPETRIQPKNHLFFTKIVVKIKLKTFYQWNGKKNVVNLVTMSS